MDRHESSATAALVVGVVVLLLSVGAAPVHGQRQLSPGTRLRLTAPEAFSGRVVGRLAQVDSASLTLVTPTRDTLQVQRAAISVAEESLGRNRAGGAILGMLAGGAAGIVLGVVCVQVCANDSGANFAPIGGFVLGVPVGLLVGLVAAPERWRPVPH